MEPLDYQNRDDARRDVASDWRRRIFGPSCAFGPSRDEVWGRLAREINARHERRGWWRDGRVVAAVGAWQITLDVFSTDNASFTRLRAPFANPGGFRFGVYRASFLTKFGTALGMQDITIGDPAFDEAFVVQGNDEARVRALLSAPRLRTLIAAQPRVTLEVKDDEGWFGATFPNGADELKFQCVGVIKDLDRLRALFDLFAATLTRLCEVGGATDAPPGVTL